LAAENGGALTARTAGEPPGAQNPSANVYLLSRSTSGEYEQKQQAPSESIEFLDDECMARGDRDRTPEPGSPAQRALGGIFVNDRALRWVQRERRCLLTRTPELSVLHNPNSSSPSSNEVRRV